VTEKEIVILIATGMVLPHFRNAIRTMLGIVCKALGRWLGLEEKAPVLPPPSLPPAAELPPHRPRRRSNR
jgi:hypothetical protein